MTSVPTWRRYLRFWRPDPAADVDDELRTHLELRVAELVAGGLSADAARAQALAEFGDVEATRRGLVEISRRMSRRRARFLWWDAARADLRYAVRGLRASPLSTVTVVLTLAIGVGAATTMYGVMRRLLVQPPPHVVAPERVSKLYFHMVHPGDSTRTMDMSSYTLFERVRDEAGAVVDVAGYGAGEELPVGTGTDAELAMSVITAPGFWRVLGTTPRLGRFLTDDEAHPATGARVVVLGHAFWQRRFGSDPGVLGTTMRIRDVPYTIVGVAPRGFRGIELAETALWLPLFARTDLGARAAWYRASGSPDLRFIVRRRSEASAESTARIEAQLSRLVQSHLTESATRRARSGFLPQVHVRLGATTGALGSDMQRLPEATLSVWLVGVAIVLLAVACANVAGLLLLRAIRRRRELMVRVALGMGRRRLTGLLVTESALLTVLGAGATVVVVALGEVWVRRELLAELAAERAGVDWHTLLLSAAVVTITTVVTALAPVLQSDDDALTAIRESGPHGSARRSRPRRELLVVQTALSVVLLVGAGLFLRSLQRIAALDLGLDTENVLAVQVDFTESGREPREVAAFFERALQRVRALPGVQHASLAVDMPLHRASASSLHLPGASDPLQGERATQLVNDVAGDFFAATGMRMVQGRPIQSADRTGAPVVVVNEALAQAGWPGRSPVGECVYTSGRQDVCATVVGVVGNARSFSLREEEPRRWYYRPLAPDNADGRVLLVQVAPGAASMVSPIRRALHELDPALPFVDIRVLGDALDPQMRPWCLGATVFTAFGVLAALLAALGLYAAVAYAVTQRTREIGVRLAIGATARQVIALVLGDGFRTALGGIVLGLVLALVGGRWIADLLFDVSPRDPVVFASVAGVLLAAALLASLAPARRASKVDPMTALRAE